MATAAAKGAKKKTVKKNICKKSSVGAGKDGEATTMVKFPRLTNQKIGGLMRTGGYLRRDEVDANDVPRVSFQDVYARLTEVENIEQREGMRVERLAKEYEYSQEVIQYLRAELGRFQMALKDAGYYLDGVNGMMAAQWMAKFLDVKIKPPKQKDDPEGDDGNDSGIGGGNDTYN